MLKKVKNYLALVLSLSIVFISIGNAYAFTRNKEYNDIELQREIQNEVVQAKCIERDNIYRQLEKQGALNMLPTYEKIIYPMIEEKILNKHGINRTIASYNRSNTYYAPNGGVVSYLSPIQGYQPTEVISIYMNRDDSYQMFLDQHSATVESLVNTVIGFIPHYLATGYAIVMSLNAVADSVAIKSINDAGGCANVINAYSREWGTKASVTTGWSDRYDIYVPSNAIDVKFERK